MIKINPFPQFVIPLNSDISLCKGLVIAGAGCGHGAMSSDEIGKVAAELSSTGKWTSELEKEECRLLYRHGSKL